jgi:hypothetical protein
MPASPTLWLRRLIKPYSRKANRPAAFTDRAARGQDGLALLLTAFAIGIVAGWPGQ